MDRFKFSSPGVFGAKPAQASKAVLNPGGAKERALTSKIAGLRLQRRRSPIGRVRRRRRLGRSARARRRAGARGCRARLCLARKRARRLWRRARCPTSMSTPTRPRGCAGKRPRHEIAGRHRRRRDLHRRHRLRRAAGRARRRPQISLRSGRAGGRDGDITQELARDFGANSVSLILHGSTAALNTHARRQGRAGRAADDARIPRRLRDRAAMARRGRLQHFRARRRKCC